MRSVLVKNVSDWGEAFAGDVATTDASRRIARTLDLTTTPD